MKRILFISVLLLLSIPLFSQDIQGTWKGNLDVFGNKLPLVFHIESDRSEYSAKMDSPAQQAKGIPVDEITFKNDSISIKIAAIGMTYSGVLQEDKTSFLGDFQQGGMSIPFELNRTDAEESIVNRPQEPEKPYPYQSEEVIFSNKKAGIDLAGTLTFPKESGKFPAVILITGSGPQNRDEEIMGHKPFLVISDYLTRNGVAVLRYDDRGVAESEGDFESSTTANFATDALAAFELLKNHPSIKSDQIGLLGHSEGGLVAIKSAAENKEIAFIGLLASSAVDGGKILLKQQEDIGRVSGLSESYLKENKKINETAFQIIRNEEDSLKLSQDLSEHFKQALKDYPEWNTSKSQGIDDDEFIKNMVQVYTEKWMRYFIAYDPQVDFKKITCPVFILNGNKDLQVNAEQNLGVFRKLSNDLKQSVTIHELENLNHLFQESQTGSPGEYAILEETFSPKALEIILEEIEKILR